MGATPRVVIVGAGFGGVSMAIGLLEHGASVTIIEDAPPAAEVTQ